MPGQPRLYGELAPWWPLLSPPEDYRSEADLYRRLILAATPDARTLLELGCGGGNNASHLKQYFTLMLTDLSPQMLAVSRSLNPDVEHVAGDMRDLRLSRRFDAVLAADAIVYMTTELDLARAMDTAFRHCRPGGVALFVPDRVVETFREDLETGGRDDATRGMRYIEWVWDPDPEDTTYVADMVYLFRYADGQVASVHDRHVCGLFATETWLRLLTSVGFSARAEQVGEDEIGTPGSVVFVAARPES